MSTENQQNLQLTWENEIHHQGEINLQWLRENCYSDGAREIDSQMRVTQPHLGEVCVQLCISQFNLNFFFFYGSRIFHKTKALNNNY